MDATLIAPPAVEPLTLAEAKAWARIDTDAFDGILPMVIASARQMAEHETGLKLITQTWRYQLTDWPDITQAFPLHPVQGAQLSYWDGVDWTALGAGVTQTYRTAEGWVVERSYGAVYPSLLSITVGPRVRADFVLGFGDEGADVPQAIRLFIAAHCAMWVQQPQAASEVKLNPHPYISRLLDPFRTFD
jgi:uncharacterized phiE125 gp8 family phage protein